MFNPEDPGYFVELSEHSLLAARTKNLTPPFVIEDVKEAMLSSKTDAADLAQEFFPDKDDEGLVRALCGVFAEKRFFYQASAEESQMAADDESFLAELFSEKLQLEAGDCETALLNGKTGGAFDPARAADQPLLLAGMVKEGIEPLKSALKDLSIIPAGLYLRALSAAGTLSRALQAADDSSLVLSLALQNSYTSAFFISREGVAAVRAVPAGLDTFFEVIQANLNLKFKGSAAKLLFDGVYDFGDIAPDLIAKVQQALEPEVAAVKEQLGRGPDKVICPGMSFAKTWMDETFAKALGIEPCQVDFPKLMDHLQVSFADPSLAEKAGPAWISLLGLVSGVSLEKGEEKPWHPCFLESRPPLAEAMQAPAAPRPAEEEAPPLPEEKEEEKPAEEAPAPAAEEEIKPEETAPPPEEKPAEEAPPPPEEKKEEKPPAEAAGGEEKPPKEEKTEPPKEEKTEAAAAPPPKKSKTKERKARRKSKLRQQLQSQEKPAEKPPVKEEKPAAESKPSEQPKPAPGGPAPEKKKSAGPLAAVILFLILIAGGVYYMKFMRETAADPEREQQRAQAPALRKAWEDHANAVKKAEEERLAKEEAERKAKEEAERRKEEEEARKKAAAERLAKARGGLVITTRPEGADVHIGDDKVKISPVNIEEMKLGEYPVVIKMKGYEDRKIQAVIEENKVTRHENIVLRPKSGALQINTEPEGAQYTLKPGEGVFITPEEGSYSGTTPAVLDKIPAGNYKLVISKKDFPDHTEKVEVRHNEKTKAFWKFPYGAVKIVTTPPGAKVRQDGKVLGETPLTLKNLLPGEFSYNLYLENHEIEDVKAAVSAGEETVIEKTLVSYSRVFKGEELDEPPRPIKQTQPVIPSGLPPMKGRIKVVLTVDENGQVDKAEIIESTAEDMNDLVRKTVERWTFSPGMRKDRPVSSRVSIEFNFLKEEPSAETKPKE